MVEFVMGILGAIALIVTFLAGCVVGGLSNSKRLKNWMNDNACYLCSEKWKHRNPFGDYDESAP